MRSERGRHCRFGMSVPLVDQLLRECVRVHKSVDVCTHRGCAWGNLFESAYKLKPCRHVWRLARKLSSKVLIRPKKRKGSVGETRLEYWIDRGVELRSRLGGGSFERSRRTGGPLSQANLTRRGPQVYFFFTNNRFPELTR